MAKLVYINGFKMRNFTSLSSICCRLLSDKVITLDVNKFDVIDHFTSELIQRKTQKCVNIKLKKTQYACSLIKTKALNVNLSSLTQDEVDKEFMQIVNDGNEDNIEQFLRNCRKHSVGPSFKKILYFLDTYSRNANIDSIIELKQLLSDQNTESNQLFKINGYFDHYLAEAYWINGEIVKSLQLFEDVYAKHSILRRRIRLMMKNLIMDITTQSEAILVSIIRFSEKIYKSYKDPFPLVCTWQACFLSECFCDQTLALELLEKNEGLCEAVVGSLPYVVTTSLKQHQVEVVYRLVELLIKYDMKSQYCAVLVSLFNYKFKLGDLKSCSEIIQWSVTYNISLPQILHQKFLMLLLKRTDINDVKPNKPAALEVNLKF